MIKLFDGYGIDTEERNFILINEITRKARKGDGRKFTINQIGSFHIQRGALFVPLANISFQ